MADQFNIYGFVTAGLRRNLVVGIMGVLLVAVVVLWRGQVSAAKAENDYLKKQNEKCEAKNERYEYVLIPGLQQKVNEAAKQIDTLAERISNSKNIKQ